MNTGDQDKKYRLLQVECYKGCDAQLQEAKHLKEKMNLLINELAKVLAPSLTLTSIQKNG